MVASEGERRQPTIGQIVDDAMEAIEREQGKVTIRVKEGEDAAELAKQALADGILPETCVLRVGDDGKTTYVCDPEP